MPSLEVLEISESPKIPPNSLHRAPNLKVLSVDTLLLALGYAGSKRPPLQLLSFKDCRRVANAKELLPNTHFYFKALHLLGYRPLILRMLGLICKLPQVILSEIFQFLDEYSVESIIECQVHRVILQLAPISLDFSREYGCGNKLVAHGHLWSDLVTDAIRKNAYKFSPEELDTAIAATALPTDERSQIAEALIDPHSIEYHRKHYSPLIRKLCVIIKYLGVEKKHINIARTLMIKYFSLLRPKSIWSLIDLSLTLNRWSIELWSSDTRWANHINLCTNCLCKFRDRFCYDFDPVPWDRCLFCRETKYDSMYDNRHVCPVCYNNSVCVVAYDETWVETFYKDAVAHGPNQWFAARMSAFKASK